MFDLRPLKHSSTLVLIGFAVACSSDSTQPDPDPVIAVQSGNNQSAETGQAVSNPLVARVSQGGSAVAGTNVTWAVTGGGGSVDPTTAATGADGSASTTWTLGASAGTHTVTASASGVDGSPLTFTATATSSGPPPLTAAVAVEDFSFTPMDVTISAGGTVTWNWQGVTSMHNVTFATGTNSSTQTSGTFNRDFPAAGTFPYQCSIHGASMSGTVTVQ